MGPVQTTRLLYDLHICRPAKHRRIVTFTFTAHGVPTYHRTAPAYPMFCQRARIIRALPFSLLGKPCAAFARQHTAHATRGLSTHTRQMNMASPTPSKVHLCVPAAQQPVFYVEGISHEAAQKASELLQANHESHHIFFDKSGFHVCTYDCSGLIPPHPIASHRIQHVLLAAKRKGEGGNGCTDSPPRTTSRTTS
jgi:hypothetical protein